MKIGGEYEQDCYNTKEGGVRDEEIREGRIQELLNSSKWLIE
jgi:hypothetical protein